LGEKRHASALSQLGIRVGWTLRVADVVTNSQASHEQELRRELTDSGRMNPFVTFVCFCSWLECAGQDRNSLLNRSKRSPRRKSITFLFTSESTPSLSHHLSAAPRTANSRRRTRKSSCDKALKPCCYDSNRMSHGAPMAAKANPLPHDRPRADFGTSASRVWLSDPKPRVQGVRR
jgi:hypothetical protein